MPYPDTARSSKKNDNAGGSASLSASAQNATAIVNTARNRAVGFANAARDWFHPPSFPDWFSSLSQIESLTTVMFSPLRGHPAYRSESLARALQLMQQQQHQRQRSTQTSSGSDVVLHSGRPALPSSSELLKAEIPESQAPLSLFQGFAAAYPSLATPGSPSSSPKKSRHRRKKHGSGAASIGADGNRTLTQIIAEREQKMKEGDKLQMQKSSTANEINQINLQIEELLNKRKALEAKWAKLEAKEQQLRLTIDSLNESIVSADDESRASDVASSRTGDNQETDSEEEIFERGKCYKTLQGHEDDVICVDFNHPKGILVSSSLDGTVRAWDLHRNRCLGDLDSHPSLVRCLKINDAHLLTGSDDGTIKQWDLSMIPPLPSSPSTASSISGQSDVPPSPAPEESLQSLSNCCVGTLEGHRGEVTALYFEKSAAVSGANDKTMKQWDLETQQCVLTLDVMWATNNRTTTSSKLHTQVPLGQWSLDGLYDYLEMSENYIGALQFWNFALASGTVDGKIRMWDLRTGQVHRTLPAHNGAITCLQFDEIHLVSGGVDKNIKIWDLRTGSVFDTLSFSDPVTSLQFDASRIVSSTTRETIDIYNRTSFQHTTLSGHNDQVNSVRFRESVLASGGNDHVVKLWAL